MTNIDAQWAAVEAKRCAVLKEVCDNIKAHGYPVKEGEGGRATLVYGTTVIAAFSVDLRGKITVQNVAGRERTRTYPRLKQTGEYNVEKMTETILDWVKDHKRRQDRLEERKRALVPYEEAFRKMEAVRKGQRAKFRASLSETGVRVVNAFNESALPVLQELITVQDDNAAVHFEGDIPIAALKVLLPFLVSPDFGDDNCRLKFEAKLSAEEAVELARKVYGK
jgi:hypothetical protein